MKTRAEWEAEPMIGNQRAEVMALLDERDALLAALKAMVHGFEFDTTNAIAYAAACAAIAKAEKVTR